MSDTAAQSQPSEEELRAYLEQLRDADVVEIVAQAYSMMATGAEVKLGRPDARLLIDALAGLVQATAERLPEQLGQGMRSGLSQLQMAQVQAEGQAGSGQPSDAPAGGEPERAGGPPGEAGARPGGQPGEQPTQRPGGAPGEQSMTDRLWIPGRGQ